MEDDKPNLDAPTLEEKDVFSEEPIVIEADYTEIEELETKEEVAAQPATLSELLARAKQGEQLDELEALLEESPSELKESNSYLEDSSLEEDDSLEEPVAFEEASQEIEETIVEEVAAQPATITELLSRARQGEEQSSELETLLKENTPHSESSVLIEDKSSKEVLMDDPDHLEEAELESTKLTDLPAETSIENQSIEEESFITGEEVPVEDNVTEEVIVLDAQLESETTSFEEFIEEPIEPEVESDEWTEEVVEEVNVTAVNEIEDNQEEDSEEWKPDESYIAEKQLLHYQYPTLDLLREPVTFEPNAIDDWVLEQAEILNETLEAFNIEAQVVGWTIGPAITQFELQLGRGVKVNKITNLSDDLKLSLAAKDIRIEAPIPGKSTVGVEIPNLKSRPVMISEVIASEEFKNSDSPLTIAMGVNLAGEAVVSTIDKMPHGLIAGATGSGKSVFINSLLVSLLYKATPNEVKLILIDPKAVELAPYNDLPHLLSPVISEPKAANEALKWAVNEMEERYQKLAAGGVRNIDHFNKKVAANGDFALKMPYIVIIIDELADLMMVASNEVQDSIARITQKARAAGIHLIVATQRPSVDVVTGTIKNNIPTRVAFMVSSQIDSRTIIDTGGAEKLLGRGDMLFQGNGMNQPNRIQGTYVEDEIDDIVDFVKDQQEPNYLFQSESLLAKAEALEGKDELFDEVLPFIIDEGTVSASSLQRKFRIGFNRASNLIDTLESENLISENKGSKPRDVYLTRSDYEEKFL
ncbi:DNA translocase FtsK [Desemzia sp. RIT 804]|uniref:DNA translocase FtsK n=1 Tax=Desemzia sp. RIT 804 TaxID=2810209 RepID=UPI001F2DDBB2|nr:DNA translocase FtsK [Desemzia sp. RIT 804]